MHFKGVAVRLILDQSHGHVREEVHPFRHPLSRLNLERAGASEVKIK
jgi:hypothetical protein